MRDTPIWGFVVCNVALVSLLGVLACGASSSAAPPHDAAGTGGAGSEELLAGAGGALTSNGARLAWIEPVPAQLQAAAATSARTNADPRASVVGVCNASEIVWTCDLSHEYVTINADYRS